MSVSNWGIQFRARVARLCPQAWPSNRRSREFCDGVFCCHRAGGIQARSVWDLSYRY
jgi:hypothetical protein